VSAFCSFLCFYIKAQTQQGKQAALCCWRARMMCVLALSQQGCMKPGPDMLADGSGTRQ
jgi:hypothetical protein